MMRKNTVSNYMPTNKITEEKDKFLGRYKLPKLTKTKNKNR